MSAAAAAEPDQRPAITATAEPDQRPAITATAVRGAPRPAVGGRTRGTYAHGMPLGYAMVGDARAEEPTLSVELRPEGAVCRLTMRGALISASVAAFEAQIDQITCTPCDAVVVDIAGLSEIDAVGVHMLVGLHHYMQARGGELVVAGASDDHMDRLAPTPLVVTTAPADQRLGTLVSGGAG